MPPGVEAPDWCNRIHCGDSRAMDAIPDHSCALGVTSPPYGVGKGYEQGQTFDQWLDMLYAVCAESARKLIPGGRLCVNIANVDRKPYRTLHLHVWQALVAAGLEPKGEIIWDKAASVGVSTAWGSWRRPTAPELRDVHEYILVAQRPGRIPGSGIGDIEAAEFTAWTQSIWRFPTVSGKRVGHEAPFPLELPTRLIKLYTYQGDVVFDPWCGSGTTCLAARMLGRRYFGYDLSPDAVALAEDYLAGRRERPELQPKRGTKTQAS